MDENLLATSVSTRQPKSFANYQKSDLTYDYDPKFDYSDPKIQVLNIPDDDCQISGKYDIEEETKIPSPTLSSELKYAEKSQSGLSKRWFSTMGKGSMRSSI